METETKTKPANPFETFCQPAQIFLLLFILDVFYGAFFKQTKKEMSAGKRGLVFFLLCVCGIGWSFVINYACGYEQYIAWGLAAIPLMYLVVK